MTIGQVDDRDHIGRALRTIEQCALHRRSLRLTCERCRSVRVFDAIPVWRTALSKPDRRCLAPVTEFQEWSVEPDPVSGKKTKHWVAVPSRPIFAFADVWRPG